jgi:hypothetical protein
MCLGLRLGVLFDLSRMPNALGSPYRTLEASMAKEPKKLDDLFHDTLKDIYFAEKKILSTLPKMAKAAQSKELKAAFEKHHGETEGQLSASKRFSR